MKYKLINRTKIPKKVLEALLLFAAPKGIKKVTVSVMYDNTDSAWHGNAVGFGKKKSIRIWIQKNKLMGPRYSNSRMAQKAGYAPIFLIRNKYEALVALFAHELRHIWQMSVSKQNFLRGRLGEYVNWDGQKQVCVKAMEKDACRYAKRVLAEYRRL